MKTLTSVYLVDDDPNSLKLLTNLLADYSVRIAGTQTNPLEAIGEIAATEPDLLFLDVEMPQMSGLDCWSRIRQQAANEPQVVFYTGYDKYLLDALRRQAFDYMLKPATREELAKVMSRYYEQRLMQAERQAGAPTTRQQSIMVVNALGEHHVLKHADIGFFRYDSSRKLWEVSTTAGAKYLLRHRTTADVILAYSRRFRQIHKQYIVNVDHVQRILDNRLHLFMDGGAPLELKLSKNYRHELMNTFYNM